MTDGAMVESNVNQVQSANDELGQRTLKSVKRKLGKLWKKQKGNVLITEHNPSFKVTYLGNVLTGWANGEGCIERPVCTLWRNYINSCRADVTLKLTVSQGGLTAYSKDHSLTEYWAHRITYCAAPTSHPRLFVWVYRHEGRRLKPELRCHAVLCPKESTAKLLAVSLKTRLQQALLEFRKDKFSKQNARLSLANSLYENPSLPKRKILLSIGEQNYKPALERSKHAPKLSSIEEDADAESQEENLPPNHLTSRQDSTLSRLISVPCPNFPGNNFRKTDSLKLIQVNGRINRLNNRIFNSSLQKILESRRCVDALSVQSNGTQVANSKRGSLANKGDEGTTNDVDRDVKSVNDTIKFTSDECKESNANDNSSEKFYNFASVDEYQNNECGNFETPLKALINQSERKSTIVNERQDKRDEQNCYNLENLDGKAKVKLENGNSKAPHILRKEKRRVDSKKCPISETIKKLTNVSLKNTKTLDFSTNSCLKALQNLKTSKSFGGIQNDDEVQTSNILQMT